MGHLTYIGPKGSEGSSTKSFLILSYSMCQGQYRQKSDVSFNSLISISGYSARFSTVSTVYSIPIQDNMAQYTVCDNGKDLSVP